MAARANIASAAACCCCCWPLCAWPFFDFCCCGGCPFPVPMPSAAAIAAAAAACCWLFVGGCDCWVAVDILVGLVAVVGVLVADNDAEGVAILLAPFIAAPFGVWHNPPSNWVKFAV